MKNKLIKHARYHNSPAPTAPLLEFLERKRWDDCSRAARWVARRFGVASPSAARAQAAAAGLGGDR